MIFNKKTILAMQAVKVLAMNGGRMKLKEISHEIMMQGGGVPPQEFMQAIMRELRIGSVVHSFRGKSGGYKMRPSAVSLMTIAEVVGDPIINRHGNVGNVTHDVMAVEKECANIMRITGFTSE